MAHSAHGHEEHPEKGYGHRHTALWLIVTVLAITMIVPALLLALTVLRK